MPILKRQVVTAPRANNQDNEAILTAIIPVNGTYALRRSRMLHISNGVFQSLNAIPFPPNFVEAPTPEQLAPGSQWRIDASNYFRIQADALAMMRSLPTGLGAAASTMLNMMSDFYWSISEYYRSSVLRLRTAGDLLCLLIGGGEEVVDEEEEDDLAEDDVAAPEPIGPPAPPIVDFEQLAVNRANGFEQVVVNTANTIPTMQTVSQQAATLGARLRVGRPMLVPEMVDQDALTRAIETMNRARQQVVDPETPPPPPPPNDVTWI